MNSVGEAQVFSTWDANWGYGQVLVRPEDRDETASVCHSGFHSFERMLFGLPNAPTTFQLALDILLTCFILRSFHVYFDDIIVFSSTLDDHFEHL